MAYVKISSIHTAVKTRIDYIKRVEKSNGLVYTNALENYEHLQFQKTRERYGKYSGLSVIHSLNQPVSHSTNQSVSQSMHQLISHISSNQSVSQSVSQSLIQYNFQSVSQSIFSNQSVSQSS